MKANRETTDANVKEALKKITKYFRFLSGPRVEPGISQKQIKPQQGHHLSRQVLLRPSR
jgi:hypothetical protein